MAKWAIVNDDLVEEEKATLHFKDLAFQRGYGIFDFLRVQLNTPIFLEDHLERFNASASGMHLTVSWTKQQLCEKIETLISKNGLSDSGLRLSLTGGYSDDGFSISKPNFVLSQHSLAPPTPKQMQTGIKLFTYDYQRPLPHLKSIDYLMAVWLQPQKVRAGADDILYHQQGQVSECPRSNFFLVTEDDRILTPATRILQGITRKKLIALAEKEFVVEACDITLEDIRMAKEAFITSTTKQVLPVRQIDAHSFRQNKISQYLLQLFRSAYLNP